MRRLILRNTVTPGGKWISGLLDCTGPANRSDRFTHGCLARRSGQPAMPTMKLHRRAILRREPLQPCRRAGINRTPRLAIGMQDGHMPAISLFQLGQITARVNAQAAI